MQNVCLDIHYRGQEFFFGVKTLSPSGLEILVKGEKPKRAFALSFTFYTKRKIRERLRERKKGEGRRREKEGRTKAKLTLSSRSTGTHACGILPPSATGDSSLSLSLNFGQNALKPQILAKMIEILDRTFPDSCQIWFSFDTHAFNLDIAKQCSVFPKRHKTKKEM